MKTLRTALLLALSALSLTSCRHKYLYMEESMSSELQVVFDWREAPTATPSSMAMYLFESDGHNPLRYIFDNREGGLIKAPIGTHHSICLNADNTDWARLRSSENIETLEISTLDATDLTAQGLSTKNVPRSEESASERVAATPSMLWGSRSNGIVVGPHKGMQTITLYPHEAICYYTVDIYDVDNLRGVSAGAVDAVISGMAEGYCMGSDAATDTPVTMPFTLRADEQAASLHGEFLTFGECATTKAKHNMTVYMVLTDGSKWWHTFDVTDQVSQAPDPHHVHIVLHGLPLPEPPAEGGTNLSADVNEWQAVNIGLQM